MIYENNTVKDLKIAYIGGGSRGWAWNLMKDLAGAEDLSGEVALYDIDYEAAKQYVANPEAYDFHKILNWCRVIDTCSELNSALLHRRNLWCDENDKMDCFS